ncbi:DEAD/DEAH box family ATP-dependent RNA helicase [Clostridia bacterium]|nr:DEAD/DEAH box family ATP-dependent RNA helicase [Clostridia bacterium]
MTFSELNLIPEILRAVDDAGYVVPSPIQEQAIPPALEGRDVLGCAQTGTGKTAAFAMPILQRLAAAPTPAGQKPRIRSLILTPTRELAVQIVDSFVAYGKHMNLRYGLLIGGVAQNPQVAVLHQGVDILIATPGRLLDLVYQGIADIGRVEIFVLDEADRMLDMGFFEDVRRVIDIIPQKRQTLFFTATMPPEILKLTRDILTDPVDVAVTPVSSTVEKTEQFVYFVQRGDKLDLLTDILKRDRTVESALIFSRTKHGADKLAHKLSRSGVDCMAIHGDKSQGARQKALNDFKRGRIRVLVATDIAARGIDISDLSHVFNFELPNEPETYVHRIGRTGRAGKSGIAVSFCDADERVYLRDIERLIKKKLTVSENERFPAPFGPLPEQQGSGNRAQGAKQEAGKGQNGQNNGGQTAAQGNGNRPHRRRWRGGGNGGGNRNSQ